MGNATCSACGLCAAACPAGAISMELCMPGYYRPVINTEACVNCRLCMRLCPELHTFTERYQAAGEGCWAAWSVDRPQRHAASTAGMMTELALAVIEKGGFVSGVLYDGNMRACRSIAGTAEEVLRMRGSKYVQVRTDAETYRELARLLQAEKHVLFCGTSCQVAAFRRFIKKDYARLLTAEILCHGCISPLLFHRYRLYTQERCGRRAVALDMRSKDISGWTRPCFKWQFSDGSHRYTRMDLNPYYRFFDHGLCEACFSCSYASSMRVADVTALDYAHVQRIHPELPADAGIAMVLANTERGAEALRSLEKDGKIGLQGADFESYMACQGAFHTPASRPVRRAEFINALAENDFEKLVSRFLPRKALARQVKARLRWTFTWIWYKLKAEKGASLPHDTQEVRRIYVCSHEAVAADKRFFEVGVWRL